ncbi:MAG: S41 family peptidase [bacterium]
MKKFLVSGTANSIFRNMNNSVKYLMLCVSFVLVLSGSLIAQTVANNEDKQIDAKIQKEIIDSVTTNLNGKYVFPDVAKEMEKYVRKQYKDKAYKDITSLNEFSQKLTTDLREVCKDKHLGIQFVSDEVLERLAGDTITPEVTAELLAEAAYDNFGFKKVERLTGNVGYLKFDGFSGYSEAGDIAIAALNFLANTDALIIDLRENGGGSPSMIQLISSYFFNEPVHLNSFYLRPEDTIKQFWTQNHVVGKRMSNIPIYVLISNYTFSAAEEFTYNLKNMERATIVGETTGGGAHPVDYFYVNNLNLGLKIPTGRAINPITGTNWEGVGITPDIEVPADQALEAAHLDALKKIKDKTTDERVIDNLNWAISTFEAKFNPITVDTEILKSYSGSYGPRQIRFEDGGLIYQREGRPEFKMIPMSEDTFWFEDIDYFRIKFVKDENGNVTELVGLYQGGRTDSNKRDSRK